MALNCLKKGSHNGLLKKDSKKIIKNLLKKLTIEKQKFKIQTSKKNFNRFLNEIAVTNESNDEPAKSKN
ncbi:hypothetical protein BpHYR1_037320 [Brachionus plicatilis]|uniref:Uncharacterized protein n=1 Tax=Brachionus plicatilis TaxID=10195 RepID=A0A3M7RYP7_BRAPC|nr:hypothetical protein BpHYR1_037320 [Brachionus plicatilis]